MPLGERSGLKPAEQMRKYLGEALLEAARENPQVVVLDGDLSNSTGASTVREAFPERFFNMGIAESNMVSVSAGLAACGYIPFATSLTTFLLCNAYDQIRLSVAIAGLNVKLAGSHSGLTTGREGPSSMSIEDFSLLGGLPTFTILVPSDPIMMRKAVKAAVEHVGPVFIRSSREAMPYIYDENAPFAIGKANLLRQGKDVTIIACGLMVAVALDAALILAEEGIQARVLDMHTLRPLDDAAIKAAAWETGAIVTAEEQLIRGGMGSAVAQVLAECCPTPMRFVGLKDEYPCSGSLEELMRKYHLMPEDVAKAARQAIAAKVR
ncbi:MAG: transketolase family protein [Anaerolineae bacterium]|nr:transketolase family protein [Anaerolineae bacterium]